LPSGIGKGFNHNMVKYSLIKWINHVLTIMPWVGILACLKNKNKHLISFLSTFTSLYQKNTMSQIGMSLQPGSKRRRQMEQTLSLSIFWSRTSSELWFSDNISKKSPWYLGVVYYDNRR